MNDFIKNLLSWLKGRLELKTYVSIFVITLIFIFVLVSKYADYIHNLQPKIAEHVDQTKGTPAVPAENSYIYADIEGAINKPGIYKLNSDSHISDLLAVSGGISPTVLPSWVGKNLNLAQKVQNSQKIYIPFEWDIASNGGDYELSQFVFDTGSCTCNDDPAEIIDPEYSEEGRTGPIVPVTPTPGTSKLSVNTATQRELEALSGIGPSYAKRIIDNKPYKNIDELIQKTKIPRSVITKITSEIGF